MKKSQSQRRQDHKNKSQRQSQSLLRGRKRSSSPQPRGKGSSKPSQGLKLKKGFLRRVLRGPVPAEEKRRQSRDNRSPRAVSKKPAGKKLWGRALCKKPGAKKDPKDYPEYTPAHQQEEPVKSVRDVTWSCTEVCLTDLKTDTELQLLKRLWKHGHLQQHKFCQHKKNGKKCGGKLGILKKFHGKWQKRCNRCKKGNLPQRRSL